MNKTALSTMVALCISLPFISFTQEHGHHSERQKHIVSRVEPQPLLSHALRLKEALSFIGSSLSVSDQRKLEALKRRPLSVETIKGIQDIFDPYCLAEVNINPEARVKTERGNAEAKLVAGGWTSFLVKVINDAGVTAPLQAESPNALSPVHGSSGSHKVKPEHVITEGEAESRFLEIQTYQHKPMQKNLSGQRLEYVVVQLYSKDAGTKEVELGFHVGQGTQDIGFRNTTHVLFTIRPSVKVRLRVEDEDGSAAMASFTITDSIERSANRFSSIYPLPSKRVAAYDEFPDFFFQQQVYRKDGEHVFLPPGKYHVTYTRGPEYLVQRKEINVPEGKDSITISFKLKRWINMAKLGWYSGDHHVHAAGCSHYDSPEEGVPPMDMWRQALGEDLNVSAVLTWGPSWYYQKKHFTGHDDKLSTNKNIMRYDVEVSGFPSSHAGHVVLLRLKEDDYPGTSSVEEWPSWTLPVFKWARSQGAIAGYAHSGWGLEPMMATQQLPNLELPKMDGIGANEYVVTVAHEVVDFYSAGDTPPIWELNMWYHTLNCGFRTRLSGETDFPCITDQRVGLCRSYYYSDKTVSYEDYVQAIKSGRSYVSEGSAHLMNFAVNGLEAGTRDSELKLSGENKIQVSANVAAYLEQLPPVTKPDERVYWHIEKARIGNTRQVPVELIVNGRPVDTVKIEADGKVRRVQFNYPLKRSSWVATRILGAAHSNPIFIQLDGKPIADAESARWCMKALDQCWKMKEPNIRSSEKAAAKEAYDDARKVYQAIEERAGR